MSKHTNQTAVAVKHPTEAPSQTQPVRDRAAVPGLHLPEFAGAEPLDEDRPEDRIRVVTQRQLNRLLFLAAEAGARLAGEGSGHDPASWMYAPLRLFDGRSAVDACRSRDAFLKGMLLHGTGFALDMEPDEMDHLLDGGWEAIAEDDGLDEAAAIRACGTRASLADFGIGRPELFTAAAVVETPVGVTHAFAAFIAVDEEEATARVRARFGASANLVALRRGFDPSEPVAMSLLSEPVTDILIDASADASSPLADGLDVFVEHRFAA